MKRKYFSYHEIIRFASYTQLYTDGTIYTPHQHLTVRHLLTRTKKRKGKYLKVFNWFDRL